MLPILGRNNVYNVVPSGGSGGTGFFINIVVSGLATINDLIVTGSSTLNDLLVQGDEVVDGNLSVNGNAVIPNLATVNLSGISPTAQIIFHNLPEFGGLNYRQLQLATLNLVGPIPGPIPGLATINGVLGGYDPVFATFTPDVDGLYCVSLNLPSITVNSVATSGTGQPSYLCQITTNGSLLQGAESSIFITQPTFASQVLGLSCTWQGRLMTTDVLSFRAGVNRLGGTDGVNNTSVNATITFLG